MVTRGFHELNIGLIKELFPEAEKYSLGEDLIIGGISGTLIRENKLLLDMLTRPVRFDGYIIIFVRKGRLKVSINVDSYVIGAKSLLVNLPQEVISLSGMEADSGERTEFIFAIASRDFLGQGRFGFNKVLQDSIRLLNTPCVTLREKDLAIAEEYYFLARKIFGRSKHNKGETLSSLFMSYAYFCLDIWARQMDMNVRSGVSVRTNQTFERFVALVSENHCEQRAVGFYAQKLSLTPKYLSKLVKEVSGRSAPEWIDSFVVIEAKNLLRYSDLSIKEIVYALNFPNQSVFYKYFKAHTGTTPLQYRKN